MSDERPAERPVDAADATTQRPAPRNPFAEPGAGDEGDVPALIQGRRSAAIHGVVFGLVMLVLVVGICVMASYAFG